MIMFSHLKFREAVAAGRIKASSFRMPGAPVANWVVIGFLVLIAPFLGIDPDTFVWFHVVPIWFAILALAGPGPCRDPACSRPDAALPGRCPGGPSVLNARPEGGAMTVTFAAIEEARHRIAGAVAVTPTIASPSLSRSGPGRNPAFSQRTSSTPAHSSPAAPQEVGRPHAGAARPRRCRHVGRQPRPGCRLPCPAPRHSGHDRHAGLHAADQGRGHAPVQCPGDPARGGVRGCHRPRPPARAGEGLSFVHPYDDAAIIAGQASASTSSSRPPPSLMYWWCRSVAVA